MEEKAPILRGESPETDSLKQITIVVYALQAASFLFPLTLFAAVILNYLKRDEARGTWFEPHFRWQIRTFWFVLLWGFLGGLTLLVGIGFFILFFSAVWLVYRITKGWLRLSEGKPV